MRSVLLILCLTCSTYAVSAGRTQHETVSGQIAAYRIPWGCINGNEYWSMVIHVPHPKAGHSEFVRVDFSLPCGKSAEWIFTRSTIQTFHLIRQKDCDGQLDEFDKLINTETKQTSTIPVPVWKRPPGAENETLPFGQIVPCYRSVDLPLMPAV